MAYFCKNCGKELSSKNKYGLCFSCLKQQQDEEKNKTLVRNRGYCM